MWPIVILTLLVLFGCQTAMSSRRGVELPQVHEEAPPTVERRDAARASPTPDSSTKTPIESAIGAAARARETVERRRYILDTRAAKKVSP